MQLASARTGDDVQVAAAATAPCLPTLNFISFSEINGCKTHKNEFFIALQSVLQTHNL